MEFNLLVKDMLFFVSCKFEMAIIKIVQVMTEIIRFAFLYVANKHKIIITVDISHDIIIFLPQ